MHLTIKRIYLFGDTRPFPSPPYSVEDKEVSAAWSSSSSGSSYSFIVLSCRKMRFRVKAIDSSVFSLALGFSSHSQTTMLCQPISASFCCSCLSRSLFRLILFTQNSRFVFGILQQAEFSTSSLILLPSSVCGKATLCPCQKQPLMKMQVLYFLSTRSGCPGSRLSFSLYRNPLLHKPFRTIISGFVSFERMEAIQSCLCCGESLSIYSLN